MGRDRETLACICLMSLKTLMVLENIHLSVAGERMLRLTLRGSGSLFKTTAVENAFRNRRSAIMDNKPAQNIQDTFLNTVRKDKTPITIYLVSGVKLTGKIRSFDKYSVLLENNSQEQLIFKHAISTVVSTRSVIHNDHRGPVALGHGTQHGIQAPVSASTAGEPAEV